MNVKDTSTVTVELSIQTHLWLIWARIADEFAARARAARVALEAERDAGKPLNQMRQELEASMIAMSATAHAIDGLYGEIREVVTVPPTTRQAWEKNRTPREGRILETFKAGFNIGRQSTGWAAELDWLFNLRDAALHHGPRSQATVPHPMGGTNVSQECADYCCEHAERGLKLLLDIASTCIDSPRKPLAGWAAHMDASVRSLGGR